MNRRDWIRAAGCSATAVALKAGSPLLGAGKQSGDQPRREIDLSPASWSLNDRDKYLKLESEFAGAHPAATATKGMVAGTSNPIAIHSGLMALQHGGTAADAALCTALTQVSLMFGAATSYAGALNALYYQASTKKVFSIDACYNTVKNEKEPLTIPPFGTPSGRSVLVPGFMAGVQAIHNRFGKLPFSTLLALQFGWPNRA
jgi:gamma-glutamyltranspeptidase / glutathione hydrolase